MKGRILSWGIWLVTNGAVYLWLFQGNAAAANLAKFVILFSMIVHILATLTDVKTPAKRTIPLAIDVAVDVLVVLCLAWFGHAGWATMTAISAILSEYIRGKKDDEETE